jgi:hypothetical protein
VAEPGQTRQTRDLVVLSTARVQIPTPALVILSKDYLEILVKSTFAKKRDVILCPECGKENPEDKNFCVWCSAAFKDSLMADTVKRFHADQEAQKELEDLREKMSKMEDLLSTMVKIPGFKKMVDEAVDQSE